MVIETFLRGPRPVYDRFYQRGRMAPEGLTYVNSWVTSDGMRCYQVMECDDPALLDKWTAAWKDLVSFEIIPVMTSAEASEQFR
jgi:hypothetical protein